MNVHTLVLGVEVKTSCSQKSHTVQDIAGLSVLIYGVFTSVNLSEVLRLDLQHQNENESENH